MYFFNYVCTRSTIMRISKSFTLHSHTRYVGSKIEKASLLQEQWKKLSIDFLPPNFVKKITLIICVSASEIQELLYANEKQRCARTILRLFNLTFVHAYTIQSFIWFNLSIFFFEVTLCLLSSFYSIKTIVCIFAVKFSREQIFTIGRSYIFVEIFDRDMFINMRLIFKKMLHFQVLLKF